MSDDRSTVEALMAALAEDARRRARGPETVTPAQIRRQADLTQREVAAELGINQTTVSDLEISPDRVRWRTLRAYMTAVGATDITVIATLDGKRVIVNLDDPAREREPRRDRREPLADDVLYRPQVEITYDSSAPAPQQAPTGMNSAPGQTDPHSRKGPA